jgi:BirA family transcriptional regulator, biotin operon repressor / biotin---[acetyl-CoA-carboxylase] ligase
MTSFTLLEFDSIHSTSDLLKENHSYFPHMTFIRANHQTKGRGQFDRVWLSNHGENLLFSVLVKDIPIHKSYELKLWILESLVIYLKRFGIDVYFKEPNDLYVDDMKICGILIETQSSSSIFEYAVIGIGINFNQKHFPGLNATSISKIKGQNYPLKPSFQELIDIMVKEYERYIG